MQSNYLTKMREFSVLEMIISFVMYYKTSQKVNRSTQTHEDENYSLHQKLDQVHNKFTNEAEFVLRNGTV